MLSTIDIYITHIKHIHLIRNFTSLKCGQDSCPQTFSNFFCLRRHLIKLHVKSRNNDSQDIASKTNSSAVSIVIKNNDAPELCQFSIIDNNLSEVSNELLNDNESLETSSKDINICVKKIETDLLKLVCKLVSISSIPRNVMFNFLHEFEHCIAEPLSSLLANNFSENILTNFLKNPFANFSTEHKLIQELINYKSFKMPINVNVSNRVTEVFRSGCPILQNVAYECVLMPIVFQIKTFFELPGVFHSTLKTMETINNSDNGVNHFLKGSIWKQTLSNFKDSDIVIPYFLYHDDFETGNALGSHSTHNTISAFYMNFPTIPQYASSLLDNIFVIMLIKAKYLKEIGYTKSCTPLIDILKMLETDGIIIQLPSGDQRVYFVLGLLLGDNLGLNSMMGFVKSFSANFYCRMCKQLKSDMQRACVENSTFNRNIDNYNCDLENSNFNMTGLRERSPFNILNSFHVVQNLSVDIMHDLFEGVLKNDLSLIILHFIEVKKYFSLEILNIRKNAFDYGEIEIKNNSLPIKIEQLKTRRLKMSATETWCFVHFFSLMVGDLVPENDPVWKFFLLTQKLLDICLYSSFTTVELNDLNETIRLHNKLFLKLFNEPLKPKAHIMTHYARVIKSSGPLKYMWSLRNEAKHKELKSYANANASRVNICFSLAMKLCFKFSNKILSKTAFEEINLVTKSQNNPNFTETLKNYCHDFANEKFELYSYIIFRGTDYKSGYYVILENDFSTIYEITELLINLKNRIILLLANQFLISKNEHLNAFEVKGKLNAQKCFNIQNSISFPLQLHKMSDGKYYFRVKML